MSHKLNVQTTLKWTEEEKKLCKVGEVRGMGTPEEEISFEEFGCLEVSIVKVKEKIYVGIFKILLSCCFLFDFWSTLIKKILHILYEFQFTIKILDENLSTLP